MNRSPRGKHQAPPSPQQQQQQQANQNQQQQQQQQRVNKLVNKNLKILKSKKRPRRHNHEKCKKKKSKEKQLLVNEATLSALDDDNNNLNEKNKQQKSDECLIINEEIIEEFHRDNIQALFNTEFDPERFLLPATKPNQHYLDRKIDAHKLFAYMLTYMDTLYDLEQNPDPFSQWRENLDDQVWNSLAYLIPLLCKQVIQEQLKNEQLVIKTEPDCLVFGDIHGNLNDLYFIYKKFMISKKFVKYKFIFLGDYVDRGSKSLECIILLMIWKLLYPKRLIILRGNHEVSKTNKKYGFQCMLKVIYSEIFIKNKILHKFIYKSINEVFNNLPVAAVIRCSNKGIFCCHGGIPNESFNNNRPWTIEQLNSLSKNFKPHDLIPRKNCPSEQSALNEILWNDPVSHKHSSNKHRKHNQHHHNKHHRSGSSINDENKKLFLPNPKRGGHCSKYTEEAIERFFQANNLRLVIRGHQFRVSKEKGHHYHFSGQQVLTIFSSSNYCGVEENTTGCVNITDDRCEPLVLRTPDEAHQYHDFNHIELVSDPKTGEVTDVIF